jgi:Sigma-70, region 4
MSRLDELPPDQRAALSLLLRQRKSYAEVATLLVIDERAVRDRAHAALAVLAPARARELSPERRLEVGDYLLGQQPGVAERLRTRTYLGGCEPARAWATELAAALAPLGGEELAEIPPAPAARPAASAVAGAAASPAASAPRREPQRVGDLSSAASAPAGAPPRPPQPRSLPSSRAGGAIVLAAIVVAAILAVVLATGGGSPAKSSSSTAGKTTGTSTTAGTGKSSGKGPKIDNQIALKATGPGSKSVGSVYVLSEGTKRAFFIEAHHIPKAKGFYYAIWLYNSPTSSLPLSKSSDVGSKHVLAGGSALPSNASEYHEILLTRQTNPHPKRPGPVVLRGPFSLR